MTERYSQREVSTMFGQMVSDERIDDTSLNAGDELHPMIDQLQKNGFSLEDITYLLEDMGFDGETVSD